MPEQEQNLQKPEPEQENLTSEQENPTPEQDNKITLTWVLLGIVAVVIMWALSSLLFK